MEHYWLSLERWWVTRPNIMLSWRPIVFWKMLKIHLRRLRTNPYHTHVKLSNHTCRQDQTRMRFNHHLHSSLHIVAGRHFGASRSLGLVHASKFKTVSGACWPSVQFTTNCSAVECFFWLLYSLSSLKEAHPFFSMSNAFIKSEALSRQAAFVDKLLLF